MSLSDVSRSRVEAALEEPTFDVDELARRANQLKARGMNVRPRGQPSPQRQTRAVEVIQRDPNVVAWVLLEATGACELCLQPAPFARENGEPYLEVHHLKR